ncbi:hypothetical protein M501DRAFT_995678 [Patellaria atrata CBS 101060]|uniref:Uncharacterized protein n=1 Tax=Patellaria atrata CBS 101060 TaxID=1346257 RepID=A0A9P4VL58_9PEZI|nr:hypothetical protein M501DRAFT_995678 [Patellaria atrata CBS 101060]
MNLFDFDSDDNGTLKISPWFWVYIAATLPLTIMTVGGWYLFKRRHSRERKNKDVEDSRREG